MFYPHEEAAAVAVSVLFFVGCFASIASKLRTGFRLYLLLALSTLLRAIGFAVRAAQVHDPLNTDLAATSLVFRQAGYGISIAVLCILCGCWFKNADARGKPPRSWPAWSVGVRLLIAPVIVFGPIMGIATAALVFGVATPDSISTGNKLRKGSSWTFLGVVSILHILANVAAAYVLRWQWRDGSAAAAAAAKPLRRSTSSLRRVNSTLQVATRDSHSWVHMLQLLCFMLQVSTVFRVVALFHPEFSENPDLFYPLQVLPELLYVLLLLLPTVMVRVGMVGNYPAFVAAFQEGKPYMPAPGGPATSSDGKGVPGEGVSAAVESSTAGSGKAPSDVEAPPA